MIKGVGYQMQLILGTDIFDVRGSDLHLRHMELCKNRMAVDVEMTGNRVVYQLISIVFTDNEGAGASVYAAI